MQLRLGETGVFAILSAILPKIVKEIKYFAILALTLHSK
jgi:hypothetical protein